MSNRWGRRAERPGGAGVFRKRMVVADGCRLLLVHFLFMPVVTYLEAIRQGIWEEMERDASVFCLGEDIGIYGGAFKVTDGLIDRFGPERVIDTPIAESALGRAAFRSALTGLPHVGERTR